jgi:ABC-type multidrug transport system permease subunit
MSVPVRLEKPSSPWLQMWLAREREFFREPGVLFWVFGFPLLLAVVLGLAFRGRGPERASVVVADEGDSAAVARALSSAPTLDAARLPPPEAEARLHRGAALVLVRPGPPATLVHDPSRPGAASAVAAVRDALERQAGRKDLLATREERVSAPGQRYIDFLIPGLLGMSLMGGGIWGVGWALVTMRIRRLLKRFAATPMSRPAFLASFGIHRVIVSVVETAFLMTFGLLAFDVRIRGSVVDFALVALCGTLAFSGLGLAIASRAQNSETANGLMNLASLPMWVLSGVFFSPSNFPDWMRPFVDALPLTALNDGLRAIANDGAGISACLGQVAILAAWGVGCFLLSLRWFRWQ